MGRILNIRFDTTDLFDWVSLQWATKCRAVLPILAGLLLSLLAACSSSSEATLPDGQRIPASLKPLSGAQITAAFGGNSLYSEGQIVKGRKLNAIIFHEKSGAVRVRAWGDWGKLNDRGTWVVNSDGQYCALWKGPLAALGEKCFRIFRDDDQVYLAPIERGGTTRSGTLLPGNYVDS